MRKALFYRDEMMETEGLDLSETFQLAHLDYWECVELHFESVRLSTSIGLSIDDNDDIKESLFVQAVWAGKVPYIEVRIIEDLPLPCPFCGCNGIKAIPHRKDNDVTCVCKNCEALTHSLKAWNNRVKL